ncbi:unnamed protein product [Rhizophagus irregularis]|uniref:Uncharacterized protein n=1 Tax=Rhizophagus irregularis TaxID=588596 RepID=A0A915ZQI1_9GLOM|nr:unnamed protein product [Rhizophagus irregularis]
MHKLKLWKVNVKKKEIKEKNISTEEDIVQELDGKEMEFQELFEEYFQDELNNKNFIVTNIHIIAIIPVTALISTTGFASRSTPESIVEYLLKQKGLKDDFSKPHKLCANLNKLERKGQEESFYEAYKYILDQYFKVQLARDNKLDLNDRIFYPLFALQFASGGGKSYFLDEFASLKNEDLDSFK